MPDYSVLIVDDEKDFLETTVNRLLKRNIDAVGAESGEQALALMRERSFDVVVLDVKMPGGMDGIQALREMKKIQPFAEVILLTGHASVETSIDGIKLDAFDYLLKPVTLEKLMAKLAEAFEKGGNGVVGISLTYEVLGYEQDMVMVLVAARGTAVVVEQ
jgi:DNA-binding NtrC family response regulator